jgi:hypothetical protein
VLRLVVLVLLVAPSAASAMCFDVSLPSARYGAGEPVCARDDGAFFGAVPQCAPVGVEIVDGCLGFEPVSGLLDEKIARRGRRIVRQLVARDACSSGWEIAYSLDGAALRAEATPLNRCQHTPLTQDGGLRALEVSGPLEGDPVTLFAEGRAPRRGVSRAALARLLLDQAQPGVCAALARGATAPAPIPAELLRGATHPCLSEVAEQLADRPELLADAERALLRVHREDPTSLRALLVRAAARGQALLEIARALRPAVDEHRVTKAALLAHTAGPPHEAATLALLELFPTGAPEWIAERAEALACDDASWALTLPEVQRALTRGTGVERRFTPLLDPRKTCEGTRLPAAVGLTRRLAEGRPAQPAAWRLLLQAMEDDPSPRVRRAARREAHARLSCGARADDLVVPAFALDALLRQGVRLPCASLPEAAPDEASRPPVDAPFDPDDDVPPPPVAPNDPVERPPLTPDPPPRADEPAPVSDLRPRGLEEMHLGVFGVARVMGQGGVAGMGLHALWFVDEGFGFTTAASLSGMCADCYTDNEVARRDLRLDLGLVVFPFPELELSPYLRGVFVMGDAEISSNARTAAAVLLGFDGGVGVEWLLSDDAVLFLEGTAFFLGEAEQSFASGIPSGPGIAPLGVPQVGGQLRVGVSLRM